MPFGRYHFDLYLFKQVPLLFPSHITKTFVISQCIKPIFHFLWCIAPQRISFYNEKGDTNFFSKFLKKRYSFYMHPSFFLFLEHVFLFSSLLQHIQRYIYCFLNKSPFFIAFQNFFGSILHEEIAQCDTLYHKIIFSHDRLYISKSKIFF